MSRDVLSTSCNGNWNNSDYGYCSDFVNRAVNRWETSYESLSCDYSVNAYSNGSGTAFQLSAVCEGRGRTANPEILPIYLVETAPELAKAQAEPESNTPAK